MTAMIPLPRLATVALLTSVLAGAGCTHIEKPDYPPEWPHSVQMDAACRSLSGSYRSEAERHTAAEVRTKPLLALTLLPFEAGVLDADSVTIEMTQDGAMQVTASAADGTALLSQRYRAEDGVYACRAGVLEFKPGKKPNRQHAPDNPLVGVTWEKVLFRKTSDSSLLMQESAGGAGLAFLLIPVYAETSHWYLFKPVGR